MSKGDYGMSGKGEAAKSMDEIRDRAQDVKHTVGEKASEVATSLKDLGSEARTYAQESFENLRGSAQEYIEQGKARAEELSETLEEQIREQPLRSMLIACGVGFALGVLFIRR